MLLQLLPRYLASRSTRLHMTGGSWYETCTQRSSHCRAAHWRAPGWRWLSEVIAKLPRGAADILVWRSSVEREPPGWTRRLRPGRFVFRRGAWGPVLAWGCPHHPQAQRQLPEGRTPPLPLCFWADVGSSCSHCFSYEGRAGFSWNWTISTLKIT